MHMKTEIKVLLDNLLLASHFLERVGLKLYSNSNNFDCSKLCASLLTPRKIHLYITIGGLIVYLPLPLSVLSHSLLCSRVSAFSLFFPAFPPLHSWILSCCWYAPLLWKMFFSLCPEKQLETVGGNQDMLKQQIFHCVVKMHHFKGT